tara:strand:+ start:1603 stop:1878 length:276 start_codon:yes stop_codon:yes gene_type:complete
MDTKHIFKYTFPGYALSALINGDYTGLDDKDESALNDFLERERGIDVWDVKCDEETGEPSEPYFSKYPEFGLACDCVDVIGIIFEKGERKI